MKFHLAVEEEEMRIGQAINEQIKLIFRIQNSPAIRDEIHVNCNFELIGGKRFRVCST